MRVCVVLFALTLCYILLSFLSILHGVYTRDCSCVHSSAKPNESLKLMLVGLQRMGKTTLLFRLRELNEAHMIVSTFNERVKGEEGKAHRPKKKGGEEGGGREGGVWERGEGGGRRGKRRRRRREMGVR